MAASYDVLALTPRYVQVEDGWVQARFAELPAVITAAATQDEAESMLADALREFLLSFAPADADAGDGPTMTVSLRAS